MYDRAPRIVSQVKPGTTEIVGPGAYDVPVPADISKRKYGESPSGLGDIFALSKDRIRDKSQPISAL